MSEDDSKNFPLDPTLDPEKIDLSDSYHVESDKYPVSGFSLESEEDALKDLEELEKEIEQNTELGNEKDELCRCKVREYDGKDYLHVRIELNAGHHHGVPAVKYFDEADQIRFEDGFIVWEDKYVADNYFIRSALEAFQDDHIHRGHVTLFQYKFQLFKSIMWFWD